MPHTMTGEAMAELRYEMQVTQTKLGEMLGKGQATIAQYEQGRMKIPLTVQYLMTRVHKEWMDGLEDRLKAHLKEMESQQIAKIESREA